MTWRRAAPRPAPAAGGRGGGGEEGQGGDAGGSSGQGKEGLGHVRQAGQGDRDAGLWPSVIAHFFGPN